MGVSVENSKVKYRIDDLRKTLARIKFLSCEPLIGSLSTLNLKKIDWVIVGRESGRKPRPMKEKWVLGVLDQCKTAGVKFIFRQWGGTNRKKTGRLLLDQTWDEMPY
jgi:protein gp37